MTIFASILILAAVLISTRIVSTALHIRKYVRSAKLSGLPYTWSFVHELGTVAFFTNAVLRWCYRDYLEQGKGWPKWARFMIKDWQYEDHRRATSEYGDTFLIITPTGLVCYTSDPSIVSRVMGRRKAFVKASDRIEILEPFGPNVVSVEGDDWKFHLAVTLPPLAAESVARLVWDETAQQIGIMTASWQPEDSHKERVYALTLNTMALAGFGRQAERSGPDSQVTLPEGHQSSLFSALNGVINHLAQIMLIPRWTLRWLWPVAYQAAIEVDNYIEEMVTQERERLISDTNEAHRETLLTAVVRSNMSAEKNKDSKTVDRTSLSNEEIKGNVFVFLLAGYETLANTVLFSTIVLVFVDGMQDKVIEEIDAIYARAAEEGRTELSYTHDFPRFRYVLAFMYEVMRVFPIVQTLARVAVGNQELSIGNKAGGTNFHSLPDGTNFITNNTAIHYNSDIWPSPDVIDPRRWLVSDPHAMDPTRPLTATQEAEIQDGKVPIPSNRKGTFMCFGEGPRACLGRNFSRVEFVAILAPLLRYHRLEWNKSDPDMAARMLKTARLRSNGSPITLNAPEDLQIKLVKRK